MTIRLFKTQGIDHYIKDIMSKVDSKILNVRDESMNEDFIESLADRICKELTPNDLNIDFDNRTSDVQMVKVSGSSFPGDFDVRRGALYSVARVSYTFPVKQGIELISISPNTRTFVYDVEAEINHKTFSIYYRTQYSNEDLSDAVRAEVKRTMEPIIKELPEMQDAINKGIADLPDLIRARAKEVLYERLRMMRKREDRNRDLNSF